MAEGLTPEQIRAYRIADNKLGELAAWNDELLAGELQQLQEMEIDLELLGFTDEDLAGIFGEQVVGAKPIPMRFRNLSTIPSRSRAICGF